MSEAYRRLCAWENLLDAWRKAARGKRRRGPTAAFEFRLADRLLALRDELERHTYRPRGYVHFHIHEPKRRKISAAPFRDRVVHHALCNVIEPRFERLFIADSYANRAGKGTHRAIDRLQELARRHRWVLRADVVRHFPSIDHQILLAMLRRVVPEDDVMELVRVVLASGAGVLTDEYRMVWFPGDDLLAACRPRGLPIGNLTSQFWSNCYLHPFDQFVTRELGCRAYLRYVDDFDVEADSPVRHEYLAGEIFAMAGGTPEHAALQVSVSGALLRQLAGRSCRVFSSDLRLRVPATGLATYADVTVVCGRVERDAEDENAVVNPTVLIVVTSKRTEAYDRGDKFEHYRTVPSLQELVLVSHRESRIDVWRRPASGGTWTETRAGAGSRQSSSRSAAASTWTSSTPPRASPSRRRAS